MSLERPYEVEYIGESADRKMVDITQHVISIDKFTDSGAGEVPSAQLMLNSDFGRFLTSGTIIDQFDEFRIKVISPYDGNDTFERIMLLDEKMPQTAEGGGYVTGIQLYAREWYLTRVKMTGHYFFITFKDMVRKIFEIYNEKRGTRAPEIIVNVDKIPPYTAGIFDYGYETSCYKALTAVLSRLSQPVSAGGAGDYFDARFTDVLGVDTVRCDIFPLGSRKKGKVAVTLKGKDIDTQYISETQQNIKGTVVIARGRAESGRYPKELGLWSGIIEEMNHAPEYEPGIAYPKDALVRWKGKTWRLTRSEGLPGEPSDSNSRWENAAFKLLRDIDYSPWTANNAPHYKNLASTNSSTDISSSKQKNVSFPDSNLVVKDGNNYRNWVDFRVSSPFDIPDNFKIGGEIPQDLRVLVDPNRGSLHTHFQGNDKFGNPYENSFVQYRGNEWIVIHTPELYHECAVLDEGVVYAFGPLLHENRFGSDPSTRLSYRYLITSLGLDVSSVHEWFDMRPFFLGHDCFHQASEVTHDTRNDHEGLQNRNLPNTTLYGGDLNTSQSAVKISYVFGPDDLILSGEVVQLFGRDWWDVSTPRNRQRAKDLVGYDFLFSDFAYKYGWWGTLFYAPFPRTGAVNAINKTKAAGGIFKQSTLDLKNLNHTSSGNQGWGYDDSDDLGQITGFQFLFKFQYTTTREEDNILFQGNLPFRVTMYDTEDNVWIQDFTYRFLGDTQQVILPISGFRIYRARNPPAITGDDVIHNILNPELRVLEIFETRKIKMITLQWQGSYDPEGRYSPLNANRYFITLGSGLVDQRPKFIGWFDAFGFIKAPIAQAKSTEYDNRHIMPNIKDYPNVTNQSQLEKIAKAEVDLAEFRVDDYTLKTTGKCDLRAGDGVFVHDEDIISTFTVGDTDAQNRDNTKQLAVRKVNYSVNASDGSSGFIRHVTLAARINPPEIV